MTDDELKAIEARAKAGTMDPWLPGALTVTEFIAAASTDIPALVAEVRRLRKIIHGVCYQCDVELTPENRHISGLMCKACALPVMDMMK